ncbi:MAG TPA: DUF4397 domain-containing protein [Clostridia bacterium]|nr:DUF4397 domain-containing protein [Clostridia bacterium]
MFFQNGYPYIYNLEDYQAKRPCPYFSQSLPERGWIAPTQGIIYTSTRQTYSYVRLFNASPNLEPVDVYANAALVASGVAYKGFTEYFQILPGTYGITVFPAGTTGPALLDTQVEIPARSIMTAALTGLSPSISIRTYFETVIQIPAGRLYLRFANLSPDSPGMDLLANGQRLFEGVSYGMATNYTPVAAGMYVFNIMQSNTGTRLLYVPNITLGAGRFYTIYAVGQISGVAPLEVLIPLDGNSYIQVG